MLAGCCVLRMANWSMIYRTMIYRTMIDRPMIYPPMIYPMTAREVLLQRPQRGVRRGEKHSEALRCGRPRGPQSARVHLSEFADDDRHLRRGRLTGRDALAWHWSAATGFAAAAKVRAIWHGCSLFQA